MMTDEQASGFVALIEQNTRSMVALGECMSKQLAAMQGHAARLDVIETALHEVVMAVRQARATQDRPADCTGKG